MAREGWWMGFESIDQSGQHQKLNVIQKWAFHIFGWREVPDEVRVHQPAWLIIRSEHNPKRSISFYWLERGGRWALSPLTSQADHQKLNVIKKSAFHFFGRRGVADGVQVHQLAQSIIRSERNPKMSISYFLAGEQWWMGFESIDQHSLSSEVEHNQNMSISLFRLEMGGGLGSSPSTSPADHQKLNIIQK